MKCPECGAPDKGCEARFQEFLAKEFTDRACGTVHHLTVTAFMLQHSSRLTREGWLYQRELLKEFLVAGKPPCLVRQQNKEMVDSNCRRFKITSRTNKPLFDAINWAKNITDVNTSNGSDYCRDVTVWAKAVLSDAVRLVPPQHVEKS